MYATIVMSLSIGLDCVHSSLCEVWTRGSLFFKVFHLCYLWWPGLVQYSIAFSSNLLAHISSHYQLPLPAFSHYVSSANNLVLTLNAYGIYFSWSLIMLKMSFDTKSTSIRATHFGLSSFGRSFLGFIRLIIADQRKNWPAVFRIAEYRLPVYLPMECINSAAFLLTNKLLFDRNWIAESLMISNLYD